MSSAFRPAVLLLLLLRASTATGWDPELHLSIFRAARRLSPALEARLPAGQLDAVELGLKEADPADKDCLGHRQSDKKPEAWVTAADLAAKIRNPNPRWTVRQRAQILGQYLHYAADCAVPAEIIGHSRYPFDGDLTLFRQKRPLLEPIEAAFKARAAEAMWADAAPEAVQAAYRGAVNLTVEAALLLPAAPGVPEGNDNGPVIFVPGVTLIDKNATGPTPDDLRILHPGIHVLEWTPRTTSAGTTAQVLVYNNLDFCVRHLFFWSANWLGGLTTSLPAQSAKLMELPGPPVNPNYVKTRFIPGDCPEQPGRASIATAWRGFAGFLRGIPVYEAFREIRPGQPTPTPAGRTTYVEYVRTDLEAIGGLEIPSLQVKVKVDSFDFEVRMRNATERKPKPLYLELQVGSLGFEVNQVHELTFDLTTLPVGGEKTFTGTIAAKTRGDATGVRIFRIRRDPLGKPAARPARRS